MLGQLSNQIFQLPWLITVHQKDKTMANLKKLVQNATATIQS